MPRTARIAPVGVFFHVINRGVGRREIFHKDEDRAAFERVLAYALARAIKRDRVECHSVNL